MMRNLVFVFAAMCAAECFGIAASQAWVTNYVAEAIASSRAELEATATVTTSNGVTEISVGSGRNAMRLVYENPTDAALEATNCTAAAIQQGVTNGTLFVWNAMGTYENPNGAIAATPTNLVYSGVGSVATNGFERFAGWFDAYGVLIQPGKSYAITNGMGEVAK